MNRTDALRLAHEVRKTTANTPVQVLEADGGQCAVAYYSGSTWLVMNEVPPATRVRWRREAAKGVS